MGTGLAEGGFFGRKISFYPVLVNNFFRHYVTKTFFSGESAFYLV